MALQNLSSLPRPFRVSHIKSSSICSVFSSLAAKRGVSGLLYFSVWGILVIRPGCGRRQGLPELEGWSGGRRVQAPVPGD